MYIVIRYFENIENIKLRAQFFFFLSRKTLFSDIHCLRTPNIETFTAFLRLPDDLGSVPVLEEMPERDKESTCLIAETNTRGNKGI